MRLFSLGKLSMKTSVGMVIVVVLAALTVCGGCFSNAKPAGIRFLSGLPMQSESGADSSYRSDTESMNEHLVSHGYGISADGLTVVGQSRNSGFVWTEAGGMKDVGRYSKWTPKSGGNDAVTALFASADGSVVGGSRSFDAFRWTNAQSMTPLTHWTAGPDGAISTTSLLDVVSAKRNTEMAQSFKWPHLYGRDESNIWAKVFGISGDGNVVVGSLQTDQLNEHAVMWNGNGAVAYLGKPSTNAEISAAHGVSADGKVIVGRYASRPNGPMEPFRWTAAEGMVPLGILPARWIACTAQCVSGDGRTVSGTYERTGGSLGRRPNERLLFVWTQNDGYRDVAELPEAEQTIPFAISHDGTSVVGEYVTKLGSRSFIWTRAEGIRDLSTAATDAGVQLNGYQLKSARGISADGTRIVGVAQNAQLKRDEAFVLDLGR